MSASIAAALLGFASQEGSTTAPPAAPPAERTMLWLADIHEMPTYERYYSPECWCQREWTVSMAVARLMHSIEDGVSWSAIYETAKAEVSKITNSTCSLEKPASAFGQLGCNAPRRLVDEMLDQAVLAAPSPLLVGVIGDLVQHEAPNVAVAEETYSRVSKAIDEKFGQTCCKCATPQGNNDVYPGYYVNISSSSFYSYQANVARETCDIPESEATLLESKGYYSLQALPGLDFLYMNTLVYHVYNGPGTWGPYPPITEEDPRGQFAWLAEKLAAAQRAASEVYLMLHICPVLDPYSMSDVWQPEYRARFWAAVQPYLDATIAGIFCGHFHVEATLATGSSAPAGQALQIFGAVSPVYMNNPVFYVAHLHDEGFRLKSISARYAEMPFEEPPRAPWKTYGFAQATNQQLKQQVRGWFTAEGEADFMATLWRFKSGQRGSSNCTDSGIFFAECATCTLNCRLSFACWTLNAFDKGAYDACLAGGEASFLQA